MSAVPPSRTLDFRYTAAYFPHPLPQFTQTIFSYLVTNPTPIHSLPGKTRFITHQKNYVLFIHTEGENQTLLIYDIATRVLNRYRTPPEFRSLDLPLQIILDEDELFRAENDSKSVRFSAWQLNETTLTKVPDAATIIDPAATTNITFLASDGPDRILIGTEKGCCYFVDLAATGDFPNTGENIKGPIISMHVCSETSLFVLTATDSYVWNHSNNTTRPLTLPPQRISPTLPPVALGHHLFFTAEKPNSLCHYYLEAEIFQTWEPSADPIKYLSGSHNRLSFLTHAPCKQTIYSFDLSTGRTKPLAPFISPSLPLAQIAIWNTSLLCMPEDKTLPPYISDIHPEDPTLVLSSTSRADQTATFMHDLRGNTRFLKTQRNIVFLALIDGKKQTLIIYDFATKLFKRALPPTQFGNIDVPPSAFMVVLHQNHLFRIRGSSIMKWKLLDDNSLEFVDNLLLRKEAGEATFFDVNTEGEFLIGTGKGGWIVVDLKKDTSTNFSLPDYTTPIIWMDQNSSSIIHIVFTNAEIFWDRNEESARKDPTLPEHPEKRRHYASLPPPQRMGQSVMLASHANKVWRGPYDTFERIEGKIPLFLDWSSTTSGLWILMATSQISFYKHTLQHMHIALALKSSLPLAHIAAWESTLLCIAEDPKYPPFIADIAL